MTSNDVARRAGVSQSTVSLVMSGKARGRVSAATEDAVRRAAAELGYRPNVAARALRLGAARSVALVVPDVTNPFFGHVMRGAQAAAWTAGYTVALIDTANDPAWELSSYEALRGGPVDGFLVFGIDPPRRRRGARPERIVLIEDESPGHPSVRLDSAAGADAVMTHLLGLGHRRIGRVAAPFERHAFRTREERWRASLAEAGLDPDAMPHARSEIDFAAAHRAARGLLEGPYPPTAIFCDDDILAGGVYLAARDLRLRIPRDVSVVGFDDLAFTLLLDPPLTTVTADAARLGALAFETLAAHMAGERVPRVRQLPVSLTVRGSTAAPRPQRE
ncbi:MAG TPA: LacI family DNA-binding transcriptional regulator [Solirubrobacteraceae bacterium]|nr:LacI family DNA-binding transcriptional regulator [Solirubrobacteraceae bacterium]